MNHIYTVLLLAGLCTTVVAQTDMESSRDVARYVEVDPFDDSETEILCVWTQEMSLREMLTFVADIDSSTVSCLILTKGYRRDEETRVKYRINSGEVKYVSAFTGSETLIDRIDAINLLTELVIADTTGEARLVIQVEGDTSTRLILDCSGIAELFHTSKQFSRIVKIPLVSSR